MSRGYPRFLYSNPKKTKSKGPFLVHTLYPKFLAKVSFLPTEQGLIIIEMWDECNDQLLINEVVEAAEKWLYYAAKEKEIIIN